MHTTLSNILMNSHRGQVILLCYKDIIIVFVYLIIIYFVKISCTLIGCTNTLMCLHFSIRETLGITFNFYRFLTLNLFTLMSTDSLLSICVRHTYQVDAQNKRTIYLQVLTYSKKKKVGNFTAVQ